MTEIDEALRRLVAEVGMGRDVRVGGSAIKARQLLAEAVVALGGQASVVSVASPIGELGLSSLIAQISGRLDLDDQDDAVLELGFKRLTGDGQTVLSILAPAGISRSALRYLQHISRFAPKLTMVVYCSPALAAMLEEPGFAALAGRLKALPVVELDTHAAPSVQPAVQAQPVLAPVPPAPEPELSRGPVGKVRRWRPAMWGAAALSVAAAAGFILLGQNSPEASVSGRRVAQADVPIRPATALVPLPAGLSEPAAAKTPQPAVAAVAPPVLVKPPASAAAKMAQLALATPPSPPLVSSPNPPVVDAIRTQVSAEAKPHIRHPDTGIHAMRHLARAQPSWPIPRYHEPEEYRWTRSYDGPPQMMVRRDTRWGSRPYLGTYSVGPDGSRIFNYDP